MLCCLSCLFLFFLIIELCFLIHPVIAKLFNPTAEIGLPTKEVKAKTYISSVTMEAKISKSSISFKTVQTFLSVLLIN